MNISESQRDKIATVSYTIVVVTLLYPIVFYYNYKLGDAKSQKDDGGLYQICNDIGVASLYGNRQIFTALFFSVLGYGIGNRKDKDIWFWPVLIILGVGMVYHLIYKTLVV